MFFYARDKPNRKEDMSKKYLAAAAMAMVLLIPQGARALTPLPSDEYLTQKFRSADTNGDGRLSRQEYVAMWRYDQEKGKKQFQKLDKDRDGSITLEEYLAPMREQRQKQKTRK